MRKAVLIGAALLVCSAMAIAQDTNSTPTSPNQGGATATTQSGSTGASSQTSTATDQSSSTSGNTVQGCLSGSSGKYMLTDATGVSYQLQGDDSQFSSNVGKEVEVTGTAGVTASASASNAPGSTPAGSTASGQASGTPDNSGAAPSTGAATANANAAKTLTVSSMRKIAESCPASQTPQQ
jgi:uncharacterized protein YdeI (BOF family)